VSPLSKGTQSFAGVLHVFRTARAGDILRNAIRNRVARFRTSSRWSNILASRLIHGATHFIPSVSTATYSD